MSRQKSDSAHEVVLKKAKKKASKTGLAAFEGQKWSKLKTAEQLELLAICLGIIDEDGNVVIDGK